MPSRRLATRRACRSQISAMPASEKLRCFPIFLSSMSESTRSMMSPTCSRLIVNEMMSAQRRLSRSSSASRETCVMYSFTAVYSSSTTSSFLRSRSDSARSLVLITVSMPFSMSSITSPMRMASRAALAIASVGVSRAEGSRLLGLPGSSASGLSGSRRSAIRAIRSVQKMNSSASATLKKKWNSTTSRAGSSPRPSIQPSTWRSSGIASTQPISLKRKLPSVTRRASGRRAQRRQDAEQPAAEIGAQHEAQRDGQRQHRQRRERRGEQHDREARVAQHREQRGDQHVEQHVARQRREDHLDAGRLHERLGRERDPLQREDDEARGR